MRQDRTGVLRSRSRVWAGQAAIGAAGLLLVGIVFAGCGSAEPGVTKLVFTSDAPSTHTQTYGNDGSTVGDLGTFEAPLRQKGRIVGELTGSRTLTFNTKDTAWVHENRIPGKQTDAQVDLWDQEQNFYVNGQGSIHAIGQRLVLDDPDPTHYPFQPNGTKQPLAVVGGTGTFRFAHGELNSTRNDDGTFRHVLILRLS